VILASSKRRHLFQSKTRPEPGAIMAPRVRCHCRLCQCGMRWV